MPASRVSESNFGLSSDVMPTIRCLGQKLSNSRLRISRAASKPLMTGTVHHLIKRRLIRGMPLRRRYPFSETRGGLVIVRVNCKG